MRLCERIVIDEDGPPSCVRFEFVICFFGMKEGWRVEGGKKGGKDGGKDGGRKT